jgi:hypothetical protein
MIFAPGSKLKPYQIQAPMDTRGAHKFVPLYPEVTCLLVWRPFLLREPLKMLSGWWADLPLQDQGRVARYPITNRNGVPPGTLSKSPSHCPTRRAIASKPHCGPLVDLDPGHENRLVLGVRTKY